MKISCFIWITLHNKVLSWENLQKRGWIGPGCRALCGRGEDSVQPLFISCTLWKNIIVLLSDVFQFLPTQFSDNLGSFLSTWTSHFSKYSVICYLPFFAIWAIWKERNRAIFDGIKPSLLSIIQHIVYLSHLYKLATTKVKKPRAIGNGPVLAFPYGFF